MSTLDSRVLHLARHGHAEADGRLSETGRQQADLLGRRLGEIPLSAVHYSPVPRAAETAERVLRCLPGVPGHQSEIVGDYPPPVGQQHLPPAYARFLAAYSAAEREAGAVLAAAALDRFARPAPDDLRELIITHNLLIGWFVRDALGAPDWRWLGLNQCNGALTTIRYSPDHPPALVTFNDMCHLPADLRWTGFPPDLRG